MHIVGPSRHLAPLVRVSSPRATPILYARSTSNVEATLQAAGKQAAVTPPWNVAPRAPLGPSDVLPGQCQIRRSFGVAVHSETHFECRDTLLRDGDSFPKVVTSK